MRSRFTASSLRLVRLTKKLTALLQFNAAARSKSFLWKVYCYDVQVVADVIFREKTRNSVMAFSKNCLTQIILLPAEMISGYFDVVESHKASNTRFCEKHRTLLQNAWFTLLSKSKFPVIEKLQIKTFEFSSINAISSGRNCPRISDYLTIKVQFADTSIF